MFAVSSPNSPTAAHTTIESPGIAKRMSPLVTRASSSLIFQKIGVEVVSSSTTVSHMAMSS